MSTLTTPKLTVMNADGPMRVRARRFLGYIRTTGSGMRMVTRWPRTVRLAWVHTALWGIALSLACFAIFGNIMTGSYGWLAWNVGIASLDSYMLVNAVHGLRWRRRYDKEYPPAKRVKRKLRGRRKSVPQ